METNDVPKQRWANYMTNSLTGDAKEIFDQLASVTRKNYDSLVEALVEALTESFPTTGHPEVALNRFLNRKQEQNESVSNFANEIEKLTKTANPLVLHLCCFIKINRYVYFIPLGIAIIPINPQLKSQLYVLVLS